MERVDIIVPVSTKKVFLHLKKPLATQAIWLRLLARVMPPIPAAPTPGGSSAPPPSPSQPLPSYAAIALEGITYCPRLTPVPLTNRPHTYIDNTPAILFTQAEDELLRKQRENTFIMKFSGSYPNLYEIRCHIASEWKLEVQTAVGVIGPRHVTLHMGSSADAKRALAHTTNKIKTHLFRLFRWTPDFEIGRDSVYAAVWVKLCNLPLHYFNEAFLY